MTFGRGTAIALGAFAAVVGLLFLTEPFDYELVEECPPRDSVCARESRSAFTCPAPLWAEPQPGTTSAERQQRCDRGRRWRWAIYGGAGTAGVAAVLVATVGVPLARSARGRQERDEDHPQPRPGGR